jgi:hypothetical protein
MRRLFDEKFVNAVRLMIDTPNVGIIQALAIQSAHEARGDRRRRPSPPRPKALARVA